MRWRLAVVVARAARAVRGLWPDHNPLRRGLDRAEAVIVGGLAVMFLAAAPLAASVAGHLAYQAGSRTARAEQSWHQTPAVLLASAPPSWDVKHGAAVRARWAVPGGAWRTGMVAAPPDAKAGSTVLVWVDAAGRLTRPPLQLSGVRAQALLAAVLAPVVLGLVLACAGLLAHGVLGRRRLAAWDFDWQITEPQWTRHH
jgi:hypothetical protein